MFVPSDFSQTDFNLLPKPMHAKRRKTSCESEAAQAGRCEYLRRAVRRPTADVEGKDRDERPRTCRKERGIENDNLELGIWDLQAHSQRCVSETSRRTRGKTSDSFTGKIAQYWQFSENSEKFSNFSTLEIQAHAAFSERILEKMPENWYSPVDIIPAYWYNRGITKNGIAKDCHLSLPLTTLTAITSHVASANYTRRYLFASIPGALPVHEIQQCFANLNH